MTKRKAIVAALIAVVALAVASAGATASRSISANPGGSITGTSAGTLTFAEGGLEVQSHVTLVGSLHRVIPKIIGWLAGLIRSCRSDRGTANVFVLPVNILCELTLPWHVRYNGFTGTLPRIATIRLIVLNATFLLHEFTVNTLVCLFRVDQLAHADVNAAGEITTITIDPSNSIGQNGLARDPECEGRPRVGQLQGRFNITPAQRVTLL
jgi:hypothetical protein